MSLPPRCKSLLISLSIILSASYSMSAQQDFRTGYFLDGYLYRYQYNPAFWGEYSYFTPAIGNSKVGFEWNTPINALLRSDGVYGSVFSHHVDWAEVAPVVPEKLNITNNASVQILSTGFWAGNTYNTISLAMRASLGVHTPASALKFIKVGADDGTTSYDIDNFRARGNSYLEASYGISLPLSSWLTMGMRFKFLMGIAAMDMNVSASYQKALGDSWNVTSQGRLRMNLPNSADLPIDAYGRYVFDDLSMPKNPFHMFKGGLPGIGGSMDIGFSADFAQYFTVAIAANDLGVISWRNSLSANAIDSSVYTPSRDPGSEVKPVDQLVKAGYSLMDSFGFVDENVDFDRRRLEWLAATFNSSLEFRLPFYQRMSIGLLGTTRLESKKIAWWEARASLNWAVLNFLSFSGSYGFSNCGQSAGVAMNLHMVGFNLFAGMESWIPLCDRSKPFLPTRGEFNTGITAGINFTFGKKHSRFGKKSIMPPYYSKKKVVEVDYYETYEY